VYHSAFDNFDWFRKFADPDFLYEQEMARVFGLELLRMANADVLPYDYGEYGKEIATYIDSAKKKAEAQFGGQALNFTEVAQAAARFEQAGTKTLSRQNNLNADPAKLNELLLRTERALLIADGLPNRPWFRHAIYAPGEYTGYAPVVIPGINEAIDKRDLDLTRQQIAALAAALDRAARVLDQR